jgi:hypothetical protein
LKNVRSEFPLSIPATPRCNVSHDHVLFAVGAARILARGADKLAHRTDHCQDISGSSLRLNIQVE